LETHLPSEQRISFMSIDVENHDFEVVQSNNWWKYRPELLLVEDSAENVGDLQESVIARFLADQGYVIYGWMPPTVVYREKECSGPSSV